MGALTSISRGKSSTVPKSKLRHTVIKAAPKHKSSFMGMLKSISRGLPNWHESWEVNSWRFRNLPNLFRGVPKLLIAKFIGCPHFYGVVYVRVFRGNGQILNLGVGSHLMITTVGVTRIVDAMRNADVVSIKDFKFHAYGSGINDPAIGDTALQTEYTVEYATDNVRPTGSQVAGDTANEYRSVALFSPSHSVTVSEIGLMDQAAVGGGDLFDRFEIAPTPIDGTVGDSMQTSIDVLLPAGS